MNNTSRTQTTTAIKLEECKWSIDDQHTYQLPESGNITIKMEEIKVEPSDFMEEVEIKYRIPDHTQEYKQEENAMMDPDSSDYNTSGSSDMVGVQPSIFPTSPIATPPPSPRRGPQPIDQQSTSSAYMPEQQQQPAMPDTTFETIPQSTDYLRQWVGEKSKELKLYNKLQMAQAQNATYIDHTKDVPSTQSLASELDDLLLKQTELAQLLDANHAAILRVKQRHLESRIIEHETLKKQCKLQTIRTSHAIQCNITNDKGRNVEYVFQTLPIQERKRTLAMMEEHYLTGDYIAFDHCKKKLKYNID